MRHINTLRYYSRRLRTFRISTYAASASFFIIIAIFPLLVLMLSAIQLTHLDPMEFIELVALILPDSVSPMLYDISQELVDASFASASVSLSLSLVMTLWTAAKSMLGLLDGLNAVADVNDTRNFIFRRMVCMGYMLLLIAALVVHLGLRVFGRHIYSVLQFTFPTLAQVFYLLLSQSGLAIFIAITLIFLLIYTVFPSKKMVWFHQLPGALFTSLAWNVFSKLFSLYVNNAHRVSSLYGGLSTVVLSMLWLYFCMCIVFLGAVINRCFPEALRMVRGYFLRRKLQISEEK